MKVNHKIKVLINVIMKINHNKIVNSNKMINAQFIADWERQCKNNYNKTNHFFKNKSSLYQIKFINRKIYQINKNFK